jgi:hypothetical protein
VLLNHLANIDGAWAAGQALERAPVVARKNPEEMHSMGNDESVTTHHRLTRGEGTWQRVCEVFHVRKNLSRKVYNLEIEGVPEYQLENGWYAHNFLRGQLRRI